MLVEFVGVLPLVILPGYFSLPFISSTNIRKFEQEWPTKGLFMDKLPLIFSHFLSNRRLWRCFEWRKNSEKSWSNFFQGNSDRWIQRGETTVKLLLFEISIWRNCLSTGCLKWLQLHTSFGPRIHFSNVPITFRARKAVLCKPCLHSRSKLQYFWKRYNENIS